MIYSLFNYIDRLQQSIEVYSISNSAMWSSRITRSSKRPFRNHKHRSGNTSEFSNSWKYTL